MEIKKSTAELYQLYKEKMIKLADVRNAAAVLHWDQETYLPKNAAAARGQQLATLATIAHELFAADELGLLLQQLAESDGLDEKQRKNVLLTKEDYDKNKKYPSSFVRELSETTSATYFAWIKARQANDYTIFEPLLNKMVALKRQETEILGFEEHPYDALIDEFEKGMTVAKLDTIFKEVKEKLLPLLEKIAQQPQVNNDFLTKFYDKDKQWELGLSLLKEMGYDFGAGRQDISEHPFTTSFHPTDVRVTTRVDENDLGNMTWSCIHEGGHALYEQGLDPAEYGLPSGEAASLAIHESQSRLWENNVARGIYYWRYNYNELQQLFPAELSGIPLEQFYKGINQVKPSFIRTEADELTYHSHVMIRYELEKALIAKTIETKDLNAIWNDYYQKFLNVNVPDDKKGILQDIHWSHGGFGYFPTYSLGSFYAAQFFQQAKKDIPDLETQISSGSNIALLKWLRENIHKYGRQYTAEELCERVTGEKLNFDYFHQYAKQKFAAIYGL